MYALLTMYCVLIQSGWLKGFVMYRVYFGSTRFYIPVWLAEAPFSDLEIDEIVKRVNDSDEQ